MAICPLTLEQGVRLTPQGLELESRNRFVQVRHFLRSCLSALRYRFSEFSAPEDCDDRTLLLLPHADLVGHMINGVHWFLPFVRALFLQHGGREAVRIAVVDRDWVETGAQHAGTPYETRSTPGFFLPLLEELSSEPVIYLSDFVTRKRSLCFKRASWGYPQLHAHSLDHQQHVVGKAVYKEALLKWKDSSPSLVAALAQDLGSCESHSLDQFGTMFCRIST